MAMMAGAGIIAGTNAYKVGLRVPPPVLVVREMCDAEMHPPSPYPHIIPCCCSHAPTVHPLVSGGSRF